MSEKVDYMIVGGGLAGSVLGYLMHKEGLDIRLFDEEKPSTSSRVAAGLYNPITGRKMVKTWNADNLFPFLEPFYKDMEQQVGGDFLRPMTIYRPFVNLAEQNEWQEKCADPAFVPYIDSVGTQSSHERINDPFGGIALKQSGYLDIPAMLDRVKAYLNEAGIWREGPFDANKMEIANGAVSYGGIKAHKVVFCTGILLDRLFNFLPFRPVKGEIIEISCQLDIRHIVNRGVFVLPLGDNKYRVGATYNWKELSEEVTAAGTEYLLDRFGKLIDVDFKVTGGKAGIRPATADRRPFIGLHPRFPEVGIFNGFGTKGVFLAPYYANQFLRALEFEEELDSEVNINRYFSLS